MEKMFKSNTMNGTRITRIRRIGADFFNGLSATIRPIRVIRVLFLLSILLALSTVFVISNNLANGIVSGKYFWFCGSMGLMSLAVCVAVFVNKINIRFSALDGLLLLFAGSVVVVYKTYPGIFKGLRIKPAMTSSIILLLVTAFCLWKQYPVYKAYKQWKNNQIYYQANLFEDTADAYGALYPYLNEQIQFLFEYAQSLSKAGFDNKQRIKNPSRCDSLLSKSNEVLRCAIQISCDPMLYNVMGKNCQAMKEYEQAETVFIKATQLVPSRLYPWYLLTKLYHEMGLQEKVNETAKIVLTKEPKVKSPAVREMREEVGKLKTEN